MSVVDTITKRKNIVCVKILHLYDCTSSTTNKKKAHEGPKKITPKVCAASEKVPVPPHFVGESKIKFSLEGKTSITGCVMKAKTGGETRKKDKWGTWANLSLRTFLGGGNTFLRVIWNFRTWFCGGGGGGLTGNPVPSPSPRMSMSKVGVSCWQDSVACSTACGGRDQNIISPLNPIIRLVLMMLLMNDSEKTSSLKQVPTNLPLGFQL